jgi:hypothetical protein
MIAYVIARSASDEATRTRLHRYARNDAELN